MTNDAWITTAQSVELSGYHLDHIRRIIRAGEIKAKKFGIVWMVSRSSLLAYVEKAEKSGRKRGPKTGA